MTSQTDNKQSQYKLLPDISRNKGYQTMKLGQLIEYNMRNVLLEKSCTKWSGDTSPRLFFKKSKIEHISRSTVSSLTQFVLLYVQVEIYQNILKLRSLPLAFTSNKALLKKNRSGTGLLPHFLHDL